MIDGAVAVTKKPSNFKMNAKQKLILKINIPYLSYLIILVYLAGFMLTRHRAFIWAAIGSMSIQGLYQIGKLGNEYGN